MISKITKPKIGILHHPGLGKDGVTRVVLNNITGLSHHKYEKVHVIGDGFNTRLPDYVEKRQVPFKELNDKKDITGTISAFEEATKDLDIIITENTALGYMPYVTVGLQEAIRNSKKQIISRHHDILHKRKERYEEDFVNAGGDVNNMFAENATHLTLTDFDKNYLHNMGVQSEVLPNSVDTERWTPNVSGKIMRQYLESVLDMPENPLIILYPGRFDKRKNHEEAIAITKGLKGIMPDKNPFLIATLNEKEEDLQRSKGFANKLNIEYSFGEIGPELDRHQNLGLADLISVSDIVLTTSVQEGFGYAFLEPWLAGKATLGRNLSDQTKDFVANGMNLSHLYDLMFSKNYLLADNVEERMEILEDTSVQRKLAENIAYQGIVTNNAVEHNAEVVRSAYNTKSIAKQLIGYF